MSRDLPGTLHDEESDGVRRTLDGEGNVVWWQYLEPETFRLTVDGEEFEVVRINDRSYDYSWLSGPNAGYGFRSTANAPGVDFDHEEAIRNFLAGIDPETGYLED